MDYDDLVTAATGDPGRVPYDYQRRIAADGLPELLEAPTGAGKTMAVVLGWLYRRRFHPDLAVRAATPRWLVFCLPMRTLVEQTERSVRDWLRNLSIGTQEPDGVRVHVFMGGEPTKRTEWRTTADNDAVVIGTQDMLLSRALNRGFGSSRFAWPLEFGALHTGTHWVFDEIQLMGAAVPTSRQLQAFRDRPEWRPSLPTASTWMSATIAPTALDTVDRPASGIASHITLSEADRAGTLATRLRAPKLLRELAVSGDVKARSKTIAEAAAAAHVPGTTTLAIVNTVEAARSIDLALRKLQPAAEIVLLHSRFRPADRAVLVDAVMSNPPAEGRIVVSTQVVEAGVDLDARTLFTEASPWSSFVQRTGRCNRAGAFVDAAVFWFMPAKPDAPVPYQAADVAAAIEALRMREGTTVVPDGLADDVATVTRPIHPVLRRKDLVALFDTTPDVAGAEIDVSPYVRDQNDDATVHVAWRDLAGLALSNTGHRPTRAEVCPVPIGELKKWVKAKNHRLRRYDYGRRRWVEAGGDDITPTMLLVTDIGSGGYTSERGWDPDSVATVPLPDPADAAVGVGEQTDDVQDDSASYRGSDDAGRPGWVTLDTHLRDTERAAAEILDRLDPDLPSAVLDAVRTSARLHDIGKAHEVFQATMEQSGGEAWADVAEHGPMAKSASRGGRHAVRHFRHELASALALLDAARTELDELAHDSRFLTVYLTAAHHGRIRLGLRSMPDEAPDVMLGIAEGQRLPAVRIGAHVVPAAELRPRRASGAEPGSEDGPWHEQAGELLDRFGPFTLGFLESLVRFADYRASAAPSEVMP